MNNAFNHFKWAQMVVNVIMHQYITFSNFYIFKGKHFKQNFIAQYELGATMMMQPKA
jgi:hypothetical protein